MSDTVPSGEPAVAPTETPSAPPAAAPAFVFGTSRGSGLARGKRASAPSSTAEKSAGAGDYKPTAVQVITSEREYKNPFESEQPAAVPAVAAAEPELPRVNPPAEETMASATTITRSEPAVAVVESSPAPVASTPSFPIAGFGGPVVKSEPTTKVELKILPPEEKTRPAQSWENTPSEEQEAPAKSSDNRQPYRREREERPVFKPELHAQRQANNNNNNNNNNSPRPYEGRREGGPRPEGRERREQQPRSFEPKAAPTPVSTPPVEAPKKSGGFFGWLKNLFSGGSEEKPSSAAVPVEQPSEERRFDDQQRRRRHRGGRGRNQGGFRGENRGPQNNNNGQQSDGDNSQPGNGGDQNRGGERRFEGGQPRRHRGGRGRGGYRGGERRPEGGGDRPESS